MKKEDLTLPWKEENNALVYTFTCNDFMDTIAYIRDIAMIAENMDHHPSLCLHEYNKVTVSLTTHDIGGVSQRDIDLAYAIEVLWKNKP